MIGGDSMYATINDNGMTCTGFNLGRGRSINLALNNSCYENPLYFSTS